MAIFKRRQRGMTMVELLVALGLFALFTLTLTQLLMGGMRVYKRGQVMSAMRNDLKLAMETVANDVRMGYDFTAVTEGRTNNLKFKVAHQDLTDPTKTLEPVAIVYELDASNGMLIRTEGTESTMLARDLVISSAIGNSESYFNLVNTATDVKNPNYTVEIRLMAMRYVGTDEQRLSMVTRATSSNIYDSGFQSAVNLVPIVNVGDLRRPLLPCFSR